MGLTSGRSGVNQTLDASSGRTEDTFALASMGMFLRAITRANFHVGEREPAVGESRYQGNRKTREHGMIAC